MTAAAGRVAEHVAALNVALATWATRDDTAPQSEMRGMCLGRIAGSPRWCPGLYSGLYTQSAKPRSP